MVSLNSDYTALGVKAARTTHRLLNGTREVDFALQNGNRKQSYKWEYEESAAD